uniref:tRNA-uridine aminocarboxypropyltransferase n=1 Tax=Kalanchoe fedtschenkoi TaxID=63787 RepID=A0A7N0UD63_KALFE
MSLDVRVRISNPNRTATAPRPCSVTTPVSRCRLPLLRNMDTPASATSKRSVCPRCSKASRTCLCGRFRSPPLDNSVAVTILQHSLERNHPLNSTRIAKLGLQNVAVANVSDVLTEARFAIQLMGVDVIGAEQCTPPVCENAAQKMQSMFSDKGSVVDVDGEILSDESNLSMDSSRCCASMSYDPTVTVTVGRYGSGCSCEIQLLPRFSPQNPDFNQLLAVPELAAAFANGFVVKRMWNQLDAVAGNDVERQTEFKLTVPRGSVLLFPSDNAVGAEALVASGIEVKNLIVLDGTWAKATRMYNENPWLKALPHLKLELDESSLYGEVRSQPKENCLSTIESIVYALKAVGGAADGLDGLLDVFESMVEDQRRCMHERLSNLTPI